MFASQKLLAWKTGYSERQIRRILESLEEQGLIVPESGGVGRGMIRSYRIELSAARKKEPMPENRTNCPQKQNGKAVKMSGGKEDRMSGYHEEKADKMSYGKADISTPISGQTGTEKRTFPTEKADISDTGPYKERARLTVENHVNPIEPAESAHARKGTAAEPTKHDDAFARIEALTKLVLGKYTTAGQIDQRTEKRVIQEVGSLNQQAATVDELDAFFAQRNRLPSLNYLAQDFTTWRANQARTLIGTAPLRSVPPQQAAAVKVGDTGRGSEEEQAPDAEILALADLTERENPDPSKRDPWMRELIAAANEIRSKSGQNVRVAV
jgi:hypothetical protein